MRAQLLQSHDPFPIASLTSWQSFIAQRTESFDRTGYLLSNDLVLGRDVPPTRRLLMGGPPNSRHELRIAQDARVL
jgi:hypothetical protein